jgi:hypothetical protein
MESPKTAVKALKLEDLHLLVTDQDISHSSTLVDLLNSHCGVTGFKNSISYLVLQVDQWVGNKFDVIKATFKPAIGQHHHFNVKDDDDHWWQTASFKVLGHSFYRVKQNSQATVVPLDNLQALFDTLAVQSRPVSRYRCTFYYPFDIDGQNFLRGEKNIADKLTPTLDSFVINESSDEKNDNSEAYLYMSPKVRQALFKLKGKADEQKINEYQLNCPALNASQTAAINTINATITAASNPKIVGAIEKLRLFSHPVSKGSYLLGITVKPQIEDKCYTVFPQLSDSEFDNTWWKIFVNGAISQQYHDEIKAMQLHHWLNYTNHIRVLYPTFAVQNKEGKSADITLTLNDTSYTVYKNGSADKQYDGSFPRNIEIPVSENILRLAALFFIDPALTDPSKNNADDVLQKMQLYSGTQYDARLYCLVNYGMLGAYPTATTAKNTLDKTFMLARYVDTFNCLTWTQEKGYKYHPPFVQALSAPDSYDRWKNITSVTGFNEFCTASMGFGYYHNTFIYKHWIYHYQYLMSYSLLNKEVLECFLRAMDKATQGMTNISPDKKPDSSYRKILRCFIIYQNQYWFEALSHEQQGLEIYNHMVQATTLDKRFEQVKDKIAFADDYMQSWRDIYFVDKADLTGIIAVVLALIAIVTTYPDQTIDELRTLIFLIVSLMTIWVFSLCFKRIRRCFRWFCNAIKRKFLNMFKRKK